MESNIPFKALHNVSMIRLLKVFEFSISYVLLDFLEFILTELLSYASEHTIILARKATSSFTRFELDDTSSIRNYRR